MKTTTTQYTATICFHLRPNRWIEADRLELAQHIAAVAIPGSTVEPDGIGGWLVGVDSDTAERIEEMLQEEGVAEFVRYDGYMVQIEAS